MVKLISIKENNRKNYQYFEECYDEHLKNYLSRIYPNHQEEYIRLMKENLLSWQYITYNEAIIGAIWLEKRIADATAATLGIFIVANECRGVGVGEKAISLCIQQNASRMRINQVELNVRVNNARAIACYTKCGFVSEKQYINQRGVEVIHMAKVIV